MEKKKRKPVWRKSYIQIITEKKPKPEPDSIPRERRGSSIPVRKETTTEYTGFCSYCGAKLEPGASFCRSCGANIEA